eukprot:CAMPEP_0172303506 /NCGR_PEP_ID=MMETSP1058-20130122/5041_1 /TAXON_ID=83371 /ORGANISM="Detonula confervacea, Strain CCMP 353" /LENGTH=490 /DNA_ID=CAMNT_0013014349 /DNA_START=55 /DNA_END=1524 /DNA_ORIENTATION=-
MPPFKKSTSVEKATAAPSASLPSSSATDDFSARRSSRVAAGRYTADNDTWVEALAVCEIPIKAGYGDKPSSNNGGSSASGGASKKNGGGLFRKFKSKNSNSNSFNEKEDDANNSNNNNNSGSAGEADVAAASQRLTLRPYFQSQNTTQRVWDEPPSGASNICYATPEARKMAEAQLEEMRSTYAHAAVQRRQEREEKKEMKKAAALETSKGGSGGKLSVLPKVFKRSSSSTAATSSAADASQSSALLGSNKHSSKHCKKTRIKGSLFLSDEGGRGGIPKSILEESKESARATRKSSYEEDLQRAMLMSMELGGGSVMGVGDNKHRSSCKSALGGGGTSTTSAATSGLTREEEEQLAMATALSLSEQEARQGRSTRRSKSSSYRRGESDDSEQSGKQRSRSQHDYLPPHMGKYNHSSSSSANHNNYANMTSNLNDFDDDFDGGGKMPARPKNNETSTNDNNNNHESNDFGDRGSSWEQQWNESSSLKKKDW